jgi:hypothetical protein
MNNLSKRLGLLCLVWALSNPLTAQVAPAAKAAATAIDHALNAAAKVSGRTLPQEARILALRELDKAALKHGHQVLDAARAGGLELLEVAAKHGDDVWTFSAKVPEAARLLAIRPHELLPLTRRIGTEVLEIEAKNPGLAKKVVEHFGDDAVKHLAKNAPPEDIAKLAGFAAKADNPATKKLLLQNYMEGGIGTHQISDGIQEGLITTAKESPEVFASTVDRLLFWLALPFLIYFGSWAIMKLIKTARS